MGIFNKPKLRRGSKKKDTVPDDLWAKCPDCGELIHTLDLKQNYQVCTHCNHHFLMDVHDRITLLADPDSFEETEEDLESANPLGFEKYDDKISLLKEKTKMKEAVVTGRASIGRHPAMLAVMDFKCFAGSMGSVVGEKNEDIRAAEHLL